MTDANPAAGARPRARPSAWLALPVLVHAALVLHGASSTSSTMDEIVYAPAGYVRLVSGGPDRNPEHPPLAKLLLGAAWLGSGVRPETAPSFTGTDAWRLGYELLYGDPARAPALLLRARAVVAIASAALAAGLGIVGTAAFGPAAGLLAATLYALDPLVVGHAGLATLDVLLAAAVFLAAALIARALDAPRPLRIAAAGAALGAALAVKGTAALLVPYALLLAAAPLAGREPGAAARAGRRAAWAAAILAAGVLVLSALCLPEGPAAWWRALELQAAHAADGHPSFAAGRHGREGWWWYYPFAWAVKTPVPVLLASLCGVVLAARALRAAPERAAFLLGLPALLGAASLVSPLALGARQLLPAVPFLALLGGAALARLWERGRPARAAALAAVAWLAAGTLAVHPHQLAYANEAAGGPARLHRLLADSNVDWGQAVPALAAELERFPVRRLWLDYWGNGLPAAHGLERYRLIRDATYGPHPRLDGARPDGRELLAVSTTLLRDVYGSDRGAHAWLRAREPVALAGHSIALFDITGDAEAHVSLANTAERVGDVQSAAEVWVRARELAPRDARVHAGLSRVFLTIGERELAARACGVARSLAPGLDERLCFEVPREGAVP